MSKHVTTYNGYVGHRVRGEVFWTQPETLPGPRSAWVFAFIHRLAAEVRITDPSGDDLFIHVEAGRLVFPTEAEGTPAGLAESFAAGTFLEDFHLAGVEHRNPTLLAAIHRPSAAAGR